MEDAGNRKVEENFESQPINEDQKSFIPVIEENVIIDKRIVKTGSVFINKKIYTEDVPVEISLTSEHLIVERIPVNQYLDGAPSPVRYEGDTIIIPVIKEVIEKRILLVEEIRITKHEQTTNLVEKIQLKKEEVTLERNK